MHAREPYYYIRVRIQIIPETAKRSGNYLYKTNLINYLINGS